MDGNTVPRMIALVLIVSVATLLSWWGMYGSAVALGIAGFLIFLSESIQ